MTVPDTPSDPDRPVRDVDAPQAGSMRELNYFAAGEQSLQAEFRNRRDRWLSPIVRLCRTLGITADVMSGLAMAMLVPFGLALFLPWGMWGPPVAVITLALHVLLDGLDGPIARAASTDGPAGSFTDMCLDHTGFLIVTTLLTAAGLLHGTAACAYAGSYTMAIVMVTLLNVLRRPMAYVIRTKYIFYVLTAFQQLAGTNVLTEAAVVFSVIHVLFAVVGFAGVRRALR